MSTQLPYPCQVTIVTVEKETPGRTVTRYQFHVDHLEPNLLLSERPSTQEAMDARKYYEGPGKT